MDKLEKVISGIKKCNNNIPGRCDKCPYRGKDTHDCVGELLNDALELLKEKQKIDSLTKPKDTQRIGKDNAIIGWCVECGGIVVKPEKRCSKCGQVIDWDWR